MPRDWVLAGVIGGINAAIGYGIGGVLVGKLVRRLFLDHRPWWPPSARVLYWLKGVTVALSIGASLLMLVPAAAWQRQIAAVMGIEGGPSTLIFLRTLVVALVVGGLLVSVSRVIKDAIKFLARVMIRRWQLNDEVAMFIGTAIVVVLIITLVNGVLYRASSPVPARSFSHRTTPPDPASSNPFSPKDQAAQPRSPRGTPWASRAVTSSAPVRTPPTSPSSTGAPAKEPIRIYAGLETADTTEGRVATLLSELQRTKAFERKVLVIIPTTGTGWVDPVAARAIESMYNGDTALVAMQYSYLPSWISFLADRDKSVEAGRAMINGIQRRWLQWPEASRPKLMLYGESLGSLAGQGAFGYLPDVVDKGFSSVLWVGPPNASTL